MCYLWQVLFNSNLMVCCVAFVVMVWVCAGCEEETGSEAHCDVGHPGCRQVLLLLLRGCECSVDGWVDGEVHI